MKDRYFKNEHVEAILRSKWYPAQVLRVVPPTILELEQYKQEPDDELSTEDKLLMLDQYGPPPELFKYEVKEEFEGKDRAVGPIHTVLSYFNVKLLFIYASKLSAFLLLGHSRLYQKRKRLLFSR